VFDKIGSRSLDIFSLVDTFVGFDGEHALLTLVRHLRGECDLDHVPNIVWRDRTTGSVRRAEIRETGSLDDLPEPDFSGIDFSRSTKPMVPYYVSKGCSYGRCAYCSDPAYSSPRERSPERAVDEIQDLVERHHPQVLLFVDAYIHPARLEPIAQGL